MNPNLGYALDFPGGLIAPYLADIARQGIKLVANAGGVNPAACAAAFEKLAADTGVKLKVAYVDQFGTKQSTTVTLTQWAK